MRIHFITLTAGLLALAGSVQGASYTFTKIAESSGGYTNMTSPSVNASGTVAFGATFAGGGHLFTSSGGIPTPVYDQTVITPSINASGQIGFISQGNVYRFTSGTPANLGSLPTLYATTISDSGNVYFTANSGLIPDKFLVSDGVNITPVDHALGLIPRQSFRPAVSSNDHTAISFPSSGISRDSVGISATYTDPTIPPPFPNTEPFTAFGEADINASKTLVFQAFWGAITHNFYRDDNGVVTQIATGNGIPAINDQNIVAALFTDGTKKLKAGVGAPTDTVLSVGDAFMGSTVTDLQFTHEGLSDGNQLAFTASLADGRTGIYVTSVPEPALAGLIIPALYLLKRRRNSSKSTL